jgi:hypothetical protein
LWGTIWGLGCSWVVLGVEQEGVGVAEAEQRRQSTITSCTIDSCYSEYT